MNNGSKESISISLPGWIIEKADLYAKKHFTNRSDYINRALRTAFSLEVVDDFDHWEKVSHREDEKS
jgi:metal-responsive CopG/Arc/MetJ family transcriptional regulator